MKMLQSTSIGTLAIAVALWAAALPVGAQSIKARGHVRANARARVQVCATIPPGLILKLGKSVPPCQVLPPGIQKKLTKEEKKELKDQKKEDTEEQKEDKEQENDKRAPVITSVEIASVTDTTALVSWKTDEPSTSQVAYGVSASYGSTTALDARLVKSHQQLLIGLTANTTYHFQVLSKDEDGNLVASNDLTLTTLVAPDKTAPVVSDVVASAITSSSAEISWKTDEPATSRVLYGVSANYGSATRFDASLVTAHKQVLIGLSANTTYHYQARSRDGAGNLGASGDLTFTTQADTTAPVISDVRATNITRSSAIIRWRTDQQADGQVLYGTTADYGSSTALNADLTKEHAQMITGLNVDTTYHFQVKSKDASGNASASADMTFATKDTAIPIISSVSASAITASSAEISWTTDEPSSSQVLYGSSEAYGFSTRVDNDRVTTHRMTVSGLSANTTYHYQVRSRDERGNLAVSNDFTLITAPADTTAPVVSGVTVAALTDHSAEISWKTDEGASSQVLYGTTASYGSSTALDAALTTDHKQVVANLTASTTYHFQVKSVDASGNVATSADGTFTTGADITAPKITAITVTRLGRNGVLIRWKTDEEASGKIYYGSTTPLNLSTALTVVGSASITDHAMVITGLQADTTYYFVVESKDASGNVSTSAEQSFRTNG